MARSPTLLRVLVVPLLGALIASPAGCGRTEGARAAAGRADGAGPGTGAGRQPAADKAGAKPGATSAEGDGRAGGEAAAGVVVNGETLPPETVQQLQQAYSAVIPPGRYWYDPVSGAYGREGQPITGQMLAGLALGGRLQADASHGTSGVYINGRQITQGEEAFLERMCRTPVVPGRYWILANGLGGYEGGPAAFNLAQCPGFAPQNGGPRSSSRTYCDANGACTTSGILGTITTAPD
jgi:hypothetical protein